MHVFSVLLCSKMEKENFMPTTQTAHTLQTEENHSWFTDLYVLSNCTAAYNLSVTIYVQILV